MILTSQRLTFWRGERMNDLHYISFTRFDFQTSWSFHLLIVSEVCRCKVLHMLLFSRSWNNKSCRARRGVRNIFARSCMLQVLTKFLLISRAQKILYRCKLWRFRSYFLGWRNFWLWRRKVETLVGGWLLVLVFLFFLEDPTASHVDAE